MKYSFIFLLYPFFLFSQSEFIESNHSGFGANIAHTQNKISSGLGGSIGLSVLGLFDFGIGYLSSSYDDEYSDHDIESSVSLIYLGYNIKRKNNFSNLKLSVGYLTNSVNRRNYTPANISGVLLSLAFSLRVYESEAIILMPSLGLTYGFLDNSYFDNSRSIALGFTLIPKLTSEFHLLLTPSISKDLVNSKFPLIIGISGGFMFSFPNE